MLIYRENYGIKQVNIQTLIICINVNQLHIVPKFQKETKASMERRSESKKSFSK